MSHHSNYICRRISSVNIELDELRSEIVLSIGIYAYRGQTTNLMSRIDYDYCGLPASPLRVIPGQIHTHNDIRL